MKHLEDIVMVMAPLSAIILIIYILAKYNYLVKKTIIEKGGKPERFSNRRYLETGCIIISIGVGLAISSLLTILKLPTNAQNMLTSAVLLVFGGIGLVLAHFIRNKFENK